MVDESELDEIQLVALTVQVSCLVANCNPLNGQEWDCEPINPAAVIHAADNLHFETDDWQTVNKRHRGQVFDDFMFHIRRMAFLYANPNSEPIEIEIERFENRARIRIYDGNHRLGSAMVRGDAEIGVLVPAHDVEDFLSLISTAEQTNKKPPSPDMVVSP